MPTAFRIGAFARPAAETRCRPLSQPASHAILGLGPRGSGIIAAIVGAFIFSAFHYIGPYGDPLQLQSFVFRMLSGLAFSALYLTRGFGITAWTHALYDAFLLLT